MSDITILSLADFHIKQRYDRVFKSIFTDFITRITDANNSFDQEWKPDFICISGDIANSGNKDEYKKAKEIITNLCNACGVDKKHVIMVPGNHDIDTSSHLEKKSTNNTLSPGKTYKQREYKEFKGSYFKELDKFLDNSLDDTSNNQATGHEEITSVFRNYSSFRKEFTDNETYHGLESLRGTDLEYLTGINVFPEYRVLFWELNNSWQSLPKLEKGDERKTFVRFGNDIIKTFINDIKQYKKEKYLVITLFHHPLHLLSINEYQPSGHNFCLYDAIVNLSDVIFSGHLHGPESKAPDNLGNIAQYILTGAFYDKKAGSKKGGNKEDQNKPDCSASLVKIDPINNEIGYRHLYHETRNGEWQLTEPHFVPLKYHHYFDTGNAKQRKDSDLKYKTVIFRIYHDNMDDENKEIVSQYFGKDFNIENEPEYDNNTEEKIYRLTQKGSKQNIRHICFLDISKSDYKNKIDGIINCSCLNKITLPLFCICKAPAGMFIPEKALDVYKSINQSYRDLIIQKKLQFTLCKIEKKG